MATRNTQRDALYTKVSGSRRYFARLQHKVAGPQGTGVYSAEWSGTGDPENDYTYYECFIAPSWAAAVVLMQRDGWRVTDT